MPPSPTITGPIFDVTSYGAQPNDSGFDDAGIQAAIDAAEAAGGGVVFFPAGRYLVNPTRGREPLHPDRRAATSSCAARARAAAAPRS